MRTDPIFFEGFNICHIFHIQILISREPPWLHPCIDLYIQHVNILWTHILTVNDDISHEMRCAINKQDLSFFLCVRIVKQ